MEFRKLRLTGFKSFVEPAELRIEPGLTGVVGPNGCGKSNLLEAIRWVMGENSPRSLRSGGMEDVIFAGTATRPARDFAEVVLHAASPTGEEIAVTRRIERGSGSAYRINGRDVRARDIALLFADAATGAHSPALVSQGRIAQVIAARPAERRAMLEEAAGIAGLHVRRREAEQRLRQTEANLARLADLMAGLDSQIAALKRQARQAERYRALSAEIRTAEARLLFARWNGAAAAAEAATAAALAAEHAVAEAQSLADEARTERAALERRLSEAREEVTDRRTDAAAHAQRIATLTGQLEAAEQRLADLDRQRARLEDDRGEADRLTVAAAGALRELDAGLAAAAAALAQEEARLPGRQRAAEAAEGRVHQAEMRLAAAGAEAAGIEAEWRIAEAALAQAEAACQRLAADAARLQRQRDAASNRAAAMRDLDSARAEAATAAARLARLRGDLHAAQQQREQLVAAREEGSARLAAARAELTGVEREWQALARDRDAREKARAARRGRPTALDAIAAVPGYERALAAVLGRDGAAPLGAAADGGEGRFWTGAEPPAPLPDSLAAHIRSCPPELAARIALVRLADEDDGRRLAPGEWLVTRDGALRRWDGLVVRGEGAAEAARLEAANRLAELERCLPPLREAAELAEQQAKTVQERLAAAQPLCVAQERAVGEAAEAERQALRRVDRASAELDRLAAREAELDETAADLEARASEAAQERAAAQARLADLPDRDAARAALAAAQQAALGARQHLQQAVAERAAQDQAIAAARERMAGQRADMRGWQARAGDAEKRLAAMQARLVEIEEERAVLAARPPALARELAEGTERSAALAARLAEGAAALAALEAEAQALEARLADLGERLASTREERATHAARAAHEEERRASLARQCGERFACPPPLLPDQAGFAAAEATGAEAAAARLDTLVAARERLGPVNLVAADELARIEAEQGASAAEQAELAEAVARLRGTIGSLNREGRERLRAAFEAVDGHFRRLFTRLFEGGQAHLALVDADDPLEAGLEIYAQPPGKRLQSLSLLSGGEQALTATALIFALFLTNPAPICVLDEVDAPLDDANIDRFCDLLDAMVRETSTRYLIVTHNAVTMSRMHRLFGVTMVERGISRLVSVDLGEAERLAAE